MLHKERKLKEQADAGGSSDKALMVERQPRRKGPQCHHCGRYGHIKRATYHRCNNIVLFVELHSLKEALEVTLGDGHTLEAAGRGTVTLEMKLPDGTMKMCKLNDVLYVPKLSHNLLSVPKLLKLERQLSLARLVVELWMQRGNQSQ